MQRDAGQHVDGVRQRAPQYPIPRFAQQQHREKDAHRQRHHGRVGGRKLDECGQPCEGFAERNNYLDRI